MTGKGGKGGNPAAAADVRPGPWEPVSGRTGGVLEGMLEKVPPPPPTHTHSIRA